MEVEMNKLIEEYSRNLQHRISEYEKRAPKEESVFQKFKGLVEFSVKNLRDVFRGKKSLLQAIEDRNNYLIERNKGFQSILALNDTVKNVVKDRITEKMDKVLSEEISARLRKNIHESIQATSKNNEMNHKYDMSGALKGYVNGREAYIGIRKKPSYWQSLKNVLTGKKTAYSAVRDNVRAVRKADTNIRGTVKGIAKTLRELRVNDSESLAGLSADKKEILARIAEMKSSSAVLENVPQLSIEEKQVENIPAIQVSSVPSLQGVAQQKAFSEKLRER